MSPRAWFWVLSLAAFAAVTSLALIWPIFAAAYGPLVLIFAAPRAFDPSERTFIEALTYRIGAHSTSDDPSRYRSQDEVDAWMKKDPVARLRRHLIYKGLLDDAKDQALEKELNAEIIAAVAEVEALPLPARETLFDDVYEAPPWHLAEQRDELLRTPPAPTHAGGGH